MEDDLDGVDVVFLQFKYLVSGFLFCHLSSWIWTKQIQLLSFASFIVIYILTFFQLNDAYEEVDEQRQVVAQWKRKAQKIQVTAKLVSFFAIIKSSAHK